MAALVNGTTNEPTGYWIAYANGAVEARGQAIALGDMSKFALNKPIVAIAATPSGRGFWLAASDGGLFSFGDARFFGSMGGTRLNSPIVAMTSTASGNGYWMFAADGGVFAFGDAPFYGSMGARPLNKPIVDAVATAPKRDGYYMLASDGGTFAFGPNASVGFNTVTATPGSTPASAALAVTASGGGMRIVDVKGNESHSAKAISFVNENVPPPSAPVVDLVSNPAANSASGYYFLLADGGVYAFDGVPFYGPQSFEVGIISSVRPSIDTAGLYAAAGDLVGARRFSQIYDILWHGAEVYLNFRSRPAYDKLEGDIQGRLLAEMAKPAPNLASVRSILAELGTKYDEVIGISANGAPLSRIFDDLAVVRTNRAYVAQGVVQDLNADLLAQARTDWATFKADYAPALALIKARSAAVAAEADAAMQAFDAKINSGGSVADLKPLAATLNTKYGVGVTLINAAARNAVAGKTKISVDDQVKLVNLNAIKVALTNARTAWKASQFAAAADQAAFAVGPLFNVVQPTLAAKPTAADVPLKTALTGFKNLAGAAGDGAAFDTAYTAAWNAVLTAEQVIAGQFWTEPAVQKFVASLAAA